MTLFAIALICFVIDMPSLVETACLSTPVMLSDNKPIVFAHVGGGDYTQLTSRVVATLVREVLGFATQLVEVDDLVVVRIYAFVLFLKCFVIYLLMLVRNKNRFWRLLLPN